MCPSIKINDVRVCPMATYKLPQIEAAFTQRRFVLDRVPSCPSTRADGTQLVPFSGHQLTLAILLYTQRRFLSM